VSKCIDNSTASHEDSAASNTYGSDIVCKDLDYTGNAKGQKFQDCMNCLQNSTAATPTENDQTWYIYNLRFAVNTCIFNATNATDPISTSCEGDDACGPLKESFLDRMQNTKNLTEFGYCRTTSPNYSYLTQMELCSQCIRQNNNTDYLANFMVALKAGCIQEPTNTYRIGLNSTVFTHNTVNITSAINTEKQSISSGAIIGITIACGVVVLVITAAIMSYNQKKHDRMEY
jgi:hypothetical protein